MPRSRPARYRVLLSREMLDQVRHQGDLERHRRIKNVHEFASLLWLIEHRLHLFERDDSIIADDREYGSTEPFLMRREISVALNRSAVRADGITSGRLGQHFMPVRAS